MKIKLSVFKNCNKIIWHGVGKTKRLSSASVIWEEVLLGICMKIKPSGLLKAKQKIDWGFTTSKYIVYLNSSF